MLRAGRRRRQKWVRDGRHAGWKHCRAQERPRRVGHVEDERLTIEELPRVNTGIALGRAARRVRPCAGGEEERREGAQERSLCHTCSLEAGRGNRAASRANRRMIRRLGKVNVENGAFASGNMARPRRAGAPERGTSAGRC